MKIVVCAKQIPGPDAPARLLPESHRLDRSGGLVLDDSDSYSVEVALRNVESQGGEVVLVSMAPAGEVAGLRTALAMGAHRAVLVSDDALAGSDALVTAKVLAAVVAREAPDLVLGATESSDGYTGTVPVQVAELLGWPAVTFARRLEVQGEELAMERQTEAGTQEVVCPLPAVVTVTAGVVEPRYPSFKGILGAKSKPVEECSLEDLGVPVEPLATAGARQEVVSVAEAAAREPGRMVQDPAAAVDEILAALESWKVI